MCLQMAPLHVINSGIGGTALAVGGTVFGAVLTGIGVFAYKMREKFKNIFRKVIK